MVDVMDPMAHEVIQVYEEQDVTHVEESIRVRVYEKDLQLSLLLQEDELAPLFSGAAWAGTRLWDAAIYLTNHFLTTYKPTLADPFNTMRIIELGAGIGVPGMAARIAGANHVIITEQDDLLKLMYRNLDDNRRVLGLPDYGAAWNHEQMHQNVVVARPLSWGVQETQAYMTKYANERIDVILSCDCVYEPLYGQSWKLLAETMDLLCEKNPQAIVIMGVERRNQDGIDKFLQFVDDATQLQWELRETSVGKSKTNRLELYYLTRKQAA